MTASKLFRFEAAHRLPRHPGKCKHLHGHSYQVALAVSGRVQPYSGFVIDFGDIGRIMSPVIDCLDHQYLNIFMRYPSAEVIAWAIWDRVFSSSSAVSVSVRETEKTECSVSATDRGDADLSYMAGQPSVEEIGPFPVPDEWGGDWARYVEYQHKRWEGALAFARETWADLEVLL